MRHSSKQLIREPEQKEVLPEQKSEKESTKKKPDTTGEPKKETFDLDSISNLLK